MRTLAITLLAVLVFAAPAQAKRRHHRMTFGFASTVAVDYWAKRGITIPCKPAPNVLTYKDTHGWGYDIQMLADEPSCTIDITPWADGLRFDSDMAWAYCQEIVHEFGHLAGLDHEHGGIMAASPTYVPWGCDHPRRFLRRHPQPQYFRTGF